MPQPKFSTVRFFIEFPDSRSTQPLSSTFLLVSLSFVPCYVPFPLTKRLPTCYDRVLVLERLADRWQAHWPDVTVEDGGPVHFQYRYVVLVRGEIVVAMHAYFGDGEVQGPRLLRLLEIVFAESDFDVA